MDQHPPLRRIDEHMEDLEEVRPGPQVVFHSLDPSVRTLWFVGRLVFWGILGVVFAIVFFTLMIGKPEWRSFLLIAGLALGALALLSIVWPFISYKHWGYAIRNTDFLIRSGVIWKRLSAVPFSRIQHVDSDSGPLERSFGIANLIIHTAGSGSGSLGVPGLQAEHAEELRDYLSEVGHTHANL